jgi:Na+-driven multidrug efflux pump
MLCPEWWGYEIVTILGGYIGVDEQAVLVVLFNLIAFMFMVPLGFSEAACTVVGNSLGANQPKLGWKYFKLLSLISLSTCFIYYLGLFMNREIVASIYFRTEDYELQLMLIKYIPLMCLVCVFDFI